MTKVGLILSGCGVQDGSEIHEAVLSMLALDEAGVEIVCMAPNKNQSRVFDHVAKQTTSETRNVLVESARIARGKIKDLAQVQASELDGVLLPGGFGAALNLSDFASAGAECTVDAGVARLLVEMHGAGKPIAAICISPAVVAAVFRQQGIQITIGTDSETANTLEKMGADHIGCTVYDCVVDEKNKIVTSPAYMLAHGIRELKEGITKTVRELVRLTGTSARVKAEATGGH